MNILKKIFFFLLRFVNRKREATFSRLILSVKNKKAALLSSLSRERGATLQDVYFTHAGIGDQILLLAAAKMFFEKTGKKLLVAGKSPELFLEEDDVIFFDLYSAALLEKYAVKTKSEILLCPYGKFRLNFISGASFKLRNGSYRIQWSRTHILANYLKKLGMSGSVDISKCRLNLGESQKVNVQGRYVCLISEGLLPYKTLPFPLMQEVVCELSREYQVVQLGLEKDPLLEGVVDLRGRLSFSQVAQCLRHASAYVGPIGGLMHLAHFVGCPSVIAISGEPVEYIGYARNVNVRSSFQCDLCDTLKLNPMHDRCPFEYACARSGFDAKVICDSVRMLNKKGGIQEVFLDEVEEEKTVGVYELLLERGVSSLRREIR